MGCRAGDWLVGWQLGRAASRGFPPPLVLLLKGCWLETRHEGQHLKGLQPTLP